MKKEEEDEFTPEGLRNWQRHRDGVIFWGKIREMFADAMTNMRLSVKDANLHKAAEFQAHAETLEEILQLPDLIIQDHAERQKEK